MAAILKASFEVVARGADWAWNYGDPRTCHLYLAYGPVPVASLIAVYLYFVLSLGPKLMKNRQPFELRTVMLVYNAVQVLWCAFIVHECVANVWHPWGYKFACQPLSMTLTPFDYKVASRVYLFFMLKVVDLLDTVFMVLRKNDRQITFLHVYHHAGMVFISWVGTKGWPGGHHTFVGFINSIVHCVMYSYYFLTLYDRKIKLVSWKKYITIMQIVQFGLNVVHEALPLVTSNCDVNNLISSTLIIQNIFMFALFSDFYLKNYSNDTVSKEESKRHD